MARSIWTGSINFGLVSIPVGLYSATEDHGIHFHQFQRGTGDRIRYQRVNERTGDQVDYADIVKGRDVGGGEHVIVEPDELDAIAPGRSRSLDILAFVGLSEIDPVYFQKTYWVGPGGEQFERPYVLLRDAMARTGRAGIARFVMRGKEYLTALRADRDVLALDTLYFADEVRDPESALGRLPQRGPGKGKELDTAVSLIESLSGPWHPREYRDTYTERVEQLIEDKRHGRETVTEAEPAASTETSELLDALQRSVSAARESREQRRAGAGAAQRVRPEPRTPGRTPR